MSLTSRRRGSDGRRQPKMSEIEAEFKDFAWAVVEKSFGKLGNLNLWT